MIAMTEDEEFECPDCGATVGAEDTKCPSCGVEFASEEEEAAPTLKEAPAARASSAAGAPLGGKEAEGEEIEEAEGEETEE
ncbi:MAG: hypothetical protein ACUVV6_09380, partial [Thermoplasmatota archaeon]